MTDQARRRIAATIIPYKDGPYLVRGDFDLLDSEGNAIPLARRTVALCRCGKSRVRPFCDGTHKLTGFRAADTAEDTPEPAVPHVTGLDILHAAQPDIPRRPGQDEPERERRQPPGLEGR